LHQVGDLFELNVKLWCQKVKQAQVWTNASPYTIFGGQMGIRTGFSPSTSVSLYQNLCNTIPYWFIHLSPM